MFERPKNFKVYDPLAPDYMVAASISAEAIEFTSPKLIWFSLDQENTELTRDEVAQIYQENKTKLVYRKPKEIYADVEVNPVLQELTRMGLETITELNIFVNAADFISRVGAEPKNGDVMYMRYVGGEKNYYVVSNVVPSQLFNFQYLGFTIYAEQQSISLIPEFIINFTENE